MVKSLGRTGSHFRFMKIDNFSAELNIPLDQ